MKQGRVYWITGLSGAGKTTIGVMVYEHIRKKKANVIRLDGDILRTVFNNLDYSLEGRKRLGYEYARLCRMLSEQGIDVIICTVAMFDEIRDWNRQNIEDYCEIFLDVEMDELIRRNQKGLYKDSNGQSKSEVYGLNLAAELPKNPDIVIKNYGEVTPEIAFRQIMEKINNLS